MFGGFFHHHRHKNLRERYHPHIPKLSAQQFSGDASSQSYVDLRSRMPPIYDQGSLGSCRYGKLFPWAWEAQVKLELKGTSNALMVATLCLSSTASCAVPSPCPCGWPMHFPSPWLTQCQRPLRGVRVRQPSAPGQPAVPVLQRAGHGGGHQ